MLAQRLATPIARALRTSRTTRGGAKSSGTGPHSLTLPSGCSHAGDSLPSIPPGSPRNPQAFRIPAHVELRPRDNFPEKHPSPQLMLRHTYSPRPTSDPILYFRSNSVDCWAQDYENGDFRQSHSSQSNGLVRLAFCPSTISITILQTILENRRISSTTTRTELWQLKPARETQLSASWNWRHSHAGGSTFVPSTPSTLRLPGGTNRTLPP
jgi:hypothetical protein